jgi:hypothetical protein
MRTLCRPTRAATLPSGVRARCLDCSVNTQPEIISVEPRRLSARPNARDKPMRATVEHHEVGTRMEALIKRHQSRNLDVLLIPGAIDHHLPNPRQPQRLAVVSADRRQRRGPFLQPYLCQPESVDFIPSTDPLQPPRRHSHRDLVSQLADPSLLSVHTTSSSARARRGVGTRSTIGHSKHHSGDFRPGKIHHGCAVGELQPTSPRMGGNHIQPRFIEDSGELIDFFQPHGLHGCLPQRTPTFWSLSHPGRTSTGSTKP